VRKAKKRNPKKKKASKTVALKTNLQQEANKHVQDEYNQSIEFHIPEQMMYNCLSAGGFNLAEGKEPVLHIRKWCNLYGNALYFIRKRDEMKKSNTDVRYANGALSAIFDLLDILMSDMVEGRLISRVVGPENQKVKMATVIFTLIKSELYKKREPSAPDLKVQKV